MSQPEQPIPSEQKALRKKSPVFVLVFFSLLLLITASYTFFQNYQTQKNLQKSISHVNEQLNVVHHFQNNLENKIFLIENTQDTIKAKLVILNKHLKENGYRANEWNLLKARYFLELANATLHWSNDNPTSIALIQEADRLLSDTNLPEVNPIREILAKTLLQLKTFSQVDVVGLLSKLDSIQNQLNHLSLNSFAIQKDTNEDASTNKDGWHAGLKESLQILKKLVIITHHEKAITPFPSQYSENILKQTIYLNLQEAQLAIVKSNDKIFHFTITQAIENIKQIVDINTPDAKAILYELIDMKNIHISPENINIVETINLLNHLIEEGNTAHVNGEPLQ